MDIEAIVNDIQNYDGTPEQRREHFQTVYPDFAERYPGIFYKSSEGTMDMKMLKFMLANLSDPKGEEKVGQALFDRFVSPAFMDRFKGK